MLAVALNLAPASGPAGAVAPSAVQPHFSVSRRSVAVWVLAGGNGSDGQYRADLFKVGDRLPTATTYFNMTGTPPSRHVVFSGIPTNQSYFFRITAPDGETRQPGSFYLPGWPWWTQGQPSIQF